MGIAAAAAGAIGAAGGGAGVATLAGTALSAGSAIAGGIAQRRQAEAQAAQSKRQAEVADIRADEIAAFRRQELQRTLSTFRAARGANGLNLTSPTAQAIAADFRRFGDAERIAEVNNARREARQLRATAEAQAKQGRAAQTSGFLRAAPSLFNFAAGLGGL